MNPRTNASVSGLGIDMGSPMEQASHRGQQQRLRTMDSLTSLNQFNKDRQSALPVRTANSERRVRITSQPTQNRPRDLAIDSDASSPEVPMVHRSHPAPLSRQNRLSLAVAEMKQSGHESASTSPSDIMSENSPDTESSATSYSSGYNSGASSLKRTKSIKKQLSQPNLTQLSSNQKTDQATNRTSMGPPSPTGKSMSRSQSSLALGSQYRNGQNTANTSLGRSNEIPRSGSRASTRGRGGSLRNNHQRRGTETSQATQGPSSAPKAKKTVPDGFGGFHEVTDDEGGSSPQQSAPQQNSQNSQKSQNSQNAQNSHGSQMRVQQVDRQIQKPNRPHTQPHQMAGRPRSNTTNSQLPVSLKVGSFYGPDGEETARIDENGRLSRSDGVRSSFSGSLPGDRHENSSRVSSDAPSHSSAPRSHFMHHSGDNEPGIGGTQSEFMGSTTSSASSSQIHKSKSQVSMRSEKGFRGLSGAEKGEAMVSVDQLNSAFSTGNTILPNNTRLADDESILLSARVGDQDNQSAHRRQASAPAATEGMPRSTSATNLDRHGTLLSSATNPSRRSKDLSRLLGNNSGKLSSSHDSGSETSSVISSKRSSTTPFGPPAVLEQGKSGKSRVDVDLVLESDLVVEGGLLKGRLEVKARKHSNKHGHLMLTQPKVRVVGFEELLNDDTRHIFYHYATVIDGSPKVGSGGSRPYVLHGSPTLSPEADNRQQLACFASAPDTEGYCVAKEGQHSIPFALELPVGKGAKGVYRGKHALVRYIVIGSVKLKNADGTNRSIAHFYRHIELYPYLNPAVVLSTSPRPIIARASKGLFLGGAGKVHLCASLHRNTWVAGQRLYVNIRIDNETNKKVRLSIL